MSNTFYIGTYTMRGDSKGIYRAALQDDGTIQLLEATAAENPSYLAFSADRKTLYAVSETEKFQDVYGGGVYAFSVDSAGKLEKKATEFTGGRGPCHVTAHEGYLYTANYSDGSVGAFELKNDIPQLRAFLHQHEGSGPNAQRQSGPHAHCVTSVPGTDELSVVDLGIDQVRFYRRNGNDFSLVQALSVTPGAGPRHIVFSPDGKLAWLAAELSSEVFVLRKDKEWSIVKKYSTLPEDVSGSSSCAAIRRSPDGKLICVSNRGHNSVAVFSADSASGLLESVGIYPLGGSEPRDIAFTADGKWLLSANQESNCVCVLSVKDNFKLLDHYLSIGKPTSILL